MMKLIVLYTVRLITIVTPFLSLTLMLGALWGVVGKTTYKDINGLTGQTVSTKKIGNILINETKNAAVCVNPVPPNTTVEDNKDQDAEQKYREFNIEWENVV